MRDTYDKSEDDNYDASEEEALREAERLDNEPSFDPETCEAGGSNGIECDPNWDGEQWICSTCGKHC
jgi:hypothetical protein